eukprot:3840540-Amphidinium_carterae.1
MGTLLLAVGSLRSLFETQVDIYLPGAAAESYEEGDKQPRHAGEHPDLAENDEEETWAGAQYRLCMSFLHKCWLWAARTIAWNLLPFNRGGVLGWLIHQVGQTAFGSKWIYVQLVLGIATVIFLLYIFGSVLGVIAFGLEWAIVRPLVAVWRIVNAVIWAKPPPRLAQLDFRGPTGAREADNDFYKQLRGRDSKGRPHHCIAFVQNQAVRLARGGTAGPPPKSHGMDFAYLQVQGSSGRSARKMLEDHEGRHVVHLCRHQPCRTGGDYAAHVSCYAFVEEDSIHELADESTLPIWWRSTGIWRSAGEHCWQVVKRVPLLARMFWHGCKCCCRRRVPHITVPESESETDHEEDICVAHCVLLGGSECGRALVDRPCKNRVVDDVTPLLEEDLEASQLKEEQHLRGQVKLCRHHWLVYRSQRHTQKCSRLACWKLGAEVMNGVRLCSEHANMACGLQMPALGSSGPVLVSRESGQDSLSVPMSRAPLGAEAASTSMGRSKHPQFQLPLHPLQTGPLSREGEGIGVPPAQVAAAKEHLQQMTRRMPSPEWCPEGDSILALVRAPDSTEYFAFSVDAVHEGQAGFLQATLPALGWQLEFPSSLGVIRSASYLAALMEMETPAFVMATRAPLETEGVNLAGQQMDESRLLLLRLRAPTAERQHPLVQIRSTLTSRGPLPQGSGEDSPPEREAFRGTAPDAGYEIVKATLDATDQGVDVKDCALRFSSLPSATHRDKYLEMAGHLRSHWQSEGSQDATEGLRVLELEAELRRAALQEGTGRQ